MYIHIEILSPTPFSHFCPKSNQSQRRLIISLHSKQNQGRIVPGLCRKNLSTNRADQTRIIQTLAKDDSRIQLLMSSSRLGRRQSPPSRWAVI